MPLKVKFSTGLPNCREGRLHPIGVVDPGWLTEVTTVAEDLGYYSIWLNEFLQTDPGVRQRYRDPQNLYDPLITAANLAALTKRLRFVTSTLVLPHHHPVPLNRAIATLDVLCNGRFTLGIGLGGSMEEFRAMRGDLGRVNRGAMLDEYVEALQILWSDRSPSYSGKYVQFEALESFPKPVQSPLPIFMAGTAEGVYRRIARFGQGWIDTFMAPAQMAEAIARLQRYVVEIRGGAASIEIARQIYVSLGATEERARANHESSQAGAATPPSFGPPGSEMVVIGTPAQVAARMREYISVGVTEMCAIFYSPTPEAAIDQMRLFATEVIPDIGS